MSRNEVKELLISLGVEEPSDEAISNYLNTIQKEVKSAEEKAARFKAEADKVKELTKQLDEINSEKLTDAEKSAKVVEEANKRVAELEQTVKTMQLQKSLAEIGITGDDATLLVGEDGSLNTEKLGEILSTREKNAVDVYKKQALDSTPSPDGKKDEGGTDKPYKETVDRYMATRKSETEAVKVVDAYK